LSSRQRFFNSKIDNSPKIARYFDGRLSTGRSLILLTNSWSWFANSWHYFWWTFRNDKRETINFLNDSLNQSLQLAIQVRMI
jgi:hypothetical protein